MTTSSERPRYSLDELENSARVPVEQQVASQVSTHAEPAIPEYDLNLARLLGIEHAG